MLFALTLATAAAEPREVAVRVQDEPMGVGLGLVIGDPSGFCAMWRPNEDMALQGAVGWSVIDERLHGSLDYLVYPVVLDLRDVHRVRFPVYAGVGGKAGLGDEKGDRAPMLLGVRVPLGITVFPTDLPFDLFLEFVPTVNVYPDTDAGLDVGLGGRLFLFD